MITNISKLPNHQRLQKCGLVSLQERRKRRNVIEVLKIINGFMNIDTVRLFELNKNPRQGRYNKTIVRSTT